MAKKPPSRSEPDRPTAVQLRQGIERLRRRIADLEGFDPTSVKERWAPETKAIQAAIDDTLSKIFGHNTSAYHRYQAAADLDRGPLFLGAGDDPLYKIHEWLKEGKAASLALLKQAAKSLEEDLVELGGSETPDMPPSSTSPLLPMSDEVFIVHGRDSPAKVEVARLIERAGLKAVILHEQANQGRTIIEKFEAHGGAAGFAVIVATPDDVGGLDTSALHPRARQNVVGEMFWFAGRLGRDRVCALVKGDIEMPSDFAGIVYTQMDDRGAWKQELLRELQAAGYKNLNWGNALA
jgi:predicted nucleotide-binding protein